MCHHRIKKSISLFAGMLMSASGMAAEGDTTVITVSGTLVDTPNCTVNNNNTIMVNFGDVVTTLIDGGEYKKTALPYTLTCNSLAQQGLKMTLTGTASSVGSSYFATNRAQLGIKITYGDSIISPNDSLTFNYGVTPVLYAVPYSSNTAALPTGGFSGSATMVFSYQ
ncbi:fimbrial protein [Enterobacter sp. Acro-832]|uniref:fimbrial protein n=1 Tax=Enterobacter sp. Acro-832 TaxID=2608348 RepID=UPI00141F5B00|nr:fimbrial protein [Enterobacter sp. Acro-832]NIG46425.1 fimbrial protein [Enterobacter sp. Acro-832]